MTLLSLFFLNGCCWFLAYCLFHLPFSISSTLVVVVVVGFHTYNLVVSGFVVVVVVAVDFIILVYIVVDILSSWLSSSLSSSSTSSSK